MRNISCSISFSFTFNVISRKFGLLLACSVVLKKNFQNGKPDILYSVRVYMHISKNQIFCHFDWEFSFAKLMDILQSSH